MNNHAILREAINTLHDCINNIPPVLDDDFDAGDDEYWEHCRIEGAAWRFV